MFKKSTPELKPPQPPTFSQILEDMETFLVERPPIEKVRTLPNPTTTTTPADGTSNISSSNVDVEHWWKVFETFCSDNEDLQHVRRKIIASQKLLEDTKREINDATDSIQREIDVALQDPPIELG